MIELFGKEYKLSSLIFGFIFLCSLGIIFLSIFYSIKFDESLINMNMGVGLILFVYSVYNLFPVKILTIKKDKG